ncbi:MAG: glycosyltransferase family 2 protein [Bradyrhizobium sp.]|nr:glycosyltransferase family 2 protein [Bradyrhizobium sp.]
MKVAAVIPCYRVSKHIIDVVERTSPVVDMIYVVDDQCPEGSGALVAQHFPTANVRVIQHQVNKGVGGAVVSGYRAALADDIDIVVKVDGDGQMDPLQIASLIAPIAARRADYTKGNRFFNIEDLRQMPFVRVLGNSALSFVNKISTGYWNIMDPTNGFTAIHKSTLKLLDLDKLAARYFFESDMLFRLSIVRATVRDVSMPALYADEESNLKIRKVLFDFPGKYLLNFFKRFFYNYILRDMNIGSIETILGSVLFIFGVTWGLFNWIASGLEGVATPVGTVMLASLPIILGSQLLLAAVAYDIYNVPSEPLQGIA